MTQQALDVARFNDESLDLCRSIERDRDGIWARRKADTGIARHSATLAPEIHTNRIEPEVVGDS